MFKVIPRGPFSARGGSAVGGRFPFSRNHPRARRAQERTKIIFVCLFWGGLILCPSAPAETVILKSGETLKGKIVERSERSIVLDIGVGVELTFYTDEIAEIKDDSAPPKVLADPPRPVAGEDVKKEAPRPAPGRISPPQIVPTTTHSAVRAGILNAPPPPKKVPQKKSFLWKVQTDKSTVYLFGSVHIGKKEFYPLAKAVEKAFEGSNALVLEIDLTKIDPVKAQELMLAHAAYPAGQTLKDDISEATLIKLQKRLHKYGLVLSQFMNLKPWFVGITLIRTQLGQLGFDERYGVESYFVERAGSKNVLGLEDLEDQVSMFDDFPDQDKLLEQSLLSQEEIDQKFGEMITAWQNGDAEALDEIIIKGELERNPQLRIVYEKLFFERNRKMLEKIKDLITVPGTYFVVVGAGHLVSEEGIVELLRGEGYTVEQL